MTSKQTFLLRSVWLAIKNPRGYTGKIIVNGRGAKTFFLFKDIFWIFRNWVVNFFVIKEPGKDFLGVLSFFMQANCISFIQVCHPGN